MKNFFKWIVVGVVVVVGAIFILESLVSGGGGSIETCEDLAPRIIEMTEEKKGPFSRRILKMYDISQNTSPDKNRLLECTATAKMDRGEDVDITFHMEKDADGDRFIGYRQQ